MTSSYLNGKKHTRRAFKGRGLSFLTESEMETIHSKTLQLLQETGFMMQDKVALDML